MLLSSVGLILLLAGREAEFPQGKANPGGPGQAPKDNLVIKEWSGKSGEGIKWEPKGKDEKGYESLVIRSPEDWKRAWGQVRPDTKAPEVDFGQHMVLVVFRGQGSTGGVLKIDEVERTDGTLRARVTATPPKKGRPAGAGFTYPHHFALVPKADKVEFVEAKRQE
jgi:PrcB C-terminal